MEKHTKVETVDEHGQPVVLDLFTEYVTYRGVPHGNPIPKVKSFRYVLDGEHCNSDRKGAWLVTESGRRVKLPDR